MTQDNDDRPFGGYMITSAVDPATGRTVQIEDRTRPYFTPATDAERAAAAARWAAESAQAGKDSRTSKFGTWYVSRRTDATAGDAPTFDGLSDAQRWAWFDEHVVAYPEQCRRAWYGIRGWIAGTFKGCHAMGTPAATALDLIEHTLPWGQNREPYRYSTLGDGLRRLLAATSTQHRMEMFSHKGQRMRRYVSYDARVAFGGYLRHLPIVPPRDGVIHDQMAIYEPYRNGKYRVEVTVPASWDRIGLAPRRSADGFTWEWPATPGESWECWLDECEMRLVDGWDWPYQIRERILFADPKMPGSDPLREYADRLTSELERCERFPKSPALRAYRAALRALTIHPVGAFHAGSGNDSRHIDSRDELDERDALADIVRDDTGWTVTNSIELTAFRSRWWRPEWSSAVYARERVTATRKALQLPREKLIAIRGDAIHLADVDPEWADSGKVGSYRKQHDVSFGKLTRVPLTGEELVALGREVG